MINTVAMAQSVAINNHKSQDSRSEEKKLAGAAGDEKVDDNQQKKPSAEVLPRTEIDVEEIPYEEVLVKPERDFQPPRVNTFFNEESKQAAAATNDKKVRKENRKVKKALQAVQGQSV